MVCLGGEGESLSVAQITRNEIVTCPIGDKCIP